MKNITTVISHRLFHGLLGDATRTILNGALFLFAIAVPSGMTTWFDGLPWTHGSETILMMVLIPALLIFGWRFLLHNGLTIALLLLVVLKLGNFAETNDFFVSKNF